MGSAGAVGVVVPDEVEVLPVLVVGATSGDVHGDLVAVEGDVGPVLRAGPHVPAGLPAEVAGQDHVLLVGVHVDGAVVVAVVARGADPHAVRAELADDVPAAVAVDHPHVAATFGQLRDLVGEVPAAHAVPAVHRDPDQRLVPDTRGAGGAGA